MLVFGHTGITLGAAVLLKGILARSYSLRTRESEVREHSTSSPQMLPAQNYPSGGRASGLNSVGNWIDIRFLLIGSLLPDIIDKPVGQFFFRDSLSNGRTFCHTLLFLALITFAGLYFYRSHRKTSMLAFAFGTFIHLICDQMWLTPQTLLWPLYGITFPKVDLTHWIQNIFYALHTDPGVYVYELVGVAILIWFVVALVRRKMVGAFIRSGKFYDS